MGTAHVTVKYREADHEVSHIYKLDLATARQMALLDPKTTGQDLDKWCVAHGGKLDDNKGQPATTVTYDDGRKNWTSFKDGLALDNGETKPEVPVTPPPASKMLARNAIGPLSIIGGFAQSLSSSKFADRTPATAEATSVKPVASFSISEDAPPPPPTTQRAPVSPRP